jgi:DNA-binding GntR family transcriptional regulator
MSGQVWFRGMEAADIVRSLRLAIQRGDLKPGDFLPSLSGLARHYGVSQQRIKTVMGTLVEGGQVQLVRRNTYRVPMVQPSRSKRRAAERASRSA